MRASGRWIFVLAVILFGFSSGAMAALTCGTSTGATTHNPLLYLSSADNAHGCKIGSCDPSYSLYVWCEDPGIAKFKFQPAGGAGTTALLNLSSNANAHAEFASLSNYSEKISINAVDWTTGLATGSITLAQASPPQTCAVGFVPVIRLSSSTNAHVGTSAPPSPSAYDYIVCAKFDSGSITCGDGAIGGSEECDGTNLNGQTCASVVGLGYIGPLTCTSSCTIDSSACTLGSTCGDNICDPGETPVSCPADCKVMEVKVEDTDTGLEVSPQEDGDTLLFSAVSGDTPAIQFQASSDKHYKITISQKNPLATNVQTAYVVMVCDAAQLNCQPLNQLTTPFADAGHQPDIYNFVNTNPAEVVQGSYATYLDTSTYTPTIPVISNLTLVQDEGPFLLLNGSPKIVNITVSAPNGPYKLVVVTLPSKFDYGSTLGLFEPKGNLKVVDFVIGSVPGGTACNNNGICEYAIGEDAVSCPSDCPLGSGGDIYILKDIEIQQPFYHDEQDLPTTDLYANIRVKKTLSSLSTVDIVVLVRDEKGNKVFDNGAAGVTKTFASGLDEDTFPIQLETAGIGPTFTGGKTYTFYVKLRPYTSPTGTPATTIESVVSNNVGSRTFVTLLGQTPIPIPDTPFWLPVLIALGIVTVLYFAQREKTAPAASSNLDRGKFAFRK